MTTRGISDPRPSIAEMREMLEMELTGRSRVGFTLLLLFDLAVGAVIASLLVTEEGLPLRTVIAFSTMLVISLVWAVFFLRTLSRRKLFLAGHRLAAARLSVAFTSLFTIGAVVLAIVDEGVRSSAFAAAGFGILMLSVAIGLLVRARRRVNALTSRRDHLQQQVSGGRLSS